MGLVTRQYKPTVRPKRILTPINQSLGLGWTTPLDLNGIDSRLATSVGVLRRTLRADVARPRSYTESECDACAVVVLSLDSVVNNGMEEPTSASVVHWMVWTERADDASNEGGCEMPPSRVYADVMRASTLDAVLASPLASTDGSVATVLVGRLTEWIDKLTFDRPSSDCVPP